MGVATVRAALTAYFQPGPDIPGLQKVYSAPPLWADGSDWKLYGNTAGGAAVAALHMVEDKESRMTVPAIFGQKQVIYQVGLMIFYQWMKPSSSPAVAEEDAWVGPLDVITDGIKARIRANPNAGDPDVVWQFGQSDNDIHIQRDIPKQLPGKVLAWNVINFEVTEVITA